jgi:subtilisin family serine protease
LDENAHTLILLQKERRSFDYGDSSVMAVRIGVVDTGVDLEHPAFKRRKPRGIGVRRDGDDYYYEPNFHDLHGHGTAMASLIHADCKKARLYSVRIAQHNRQDVTPFVPEQALAMGIEWCVDQGIRVINLSYSIKEAAEGGSLIKACQKAFENGAVIIAAYRNADNCAVFPAAFQSVIGVRSRQDLQSGKISIISRENHDLFAWGGSNSSACAHVTSMVGRIHSIDSSLGLEQVFAYLMEVAVP